MKKLDLSSMGVQELNTLEIKEKNGGVLGFLSLFILAASAIGGYLVGTWICEKLNN